MVETSCINAVYDFNIFIIINPFSVFNLKTSESSVYRRQILMSQDSLRAERVNTDIAGK